jgi:CBS domain-containing protein
MEPLLVRTLMNSPVITISPSTTLPYIKTLLREHQIRRLPVVDRNRLVGIVTLGDVRNACPSEATTLSIYELSYLLTTVTAANIMRQSVVAVQADSAVADAARLMLTQKISGLPVLDGSQLVGMLTESDIFRAVISGQVMLTASSIAMPVGRTPRVLV